MSIFAIGGDKVVVPESMLSPAMESDAYFKPGIIHGGDDYLINIYLNRDSDPTSFEVNYISKGLILDAQRHDPSLGFEFKQYLLSESKAFGCYNNGEGDFACLVEMWPQAEYMTASELVAWATA